MRRLCLTCTAVLLLVGCGEEPRTATLAPAPEADPSWAIDGGREADGRLIIVAQGEAADAGAALEAARQAGLRALAEYRGVRITAIFTSVTAEVSDGGSSGVVDRAAQATRSATGTLLARAVPGRSSTVRLPDGRVRGWTELGIPLDELMPERRLQDLLQRQPGSARRSALVAESQRWLSGDALQRSLAPLAAMAALRDGGGAAEMLLLARCHFELEDLSRARENLEAAIPLLEGSPQEMFAAFSALESQLAARSGSAAELAAGMRGLVRGLAGSGALHASATRLPAGAGWSVSFTLSGKPRRLIGLWIDDEDLAPMPNTFDAQQRSGVFSLTIPPARGIIAVLAVSPDDPIAALALELPSLPLKQPASAAALERWRAFFRVLNQRPASAGFSVDLTAQ